MKNDELDLRIKLLAQEVPKVAQRRYEGGKIFRNQQHESSAISIELELLNMQIMGLTLVLTELVKRLPEPKQ